MNKIEDGTSIDQIKDLYTQEYLCQAAGYTNICPSEVYTSNELNICEMLYCESGDGTGCVSAGIIPPEGQFNLMYPPFAAILVMLGIT